MSKVYLLGAGPGDPGLLTLKARDILAAADIVVYDYLASPGLLKHCRDDAQRIYVGKKGGEHTMSQADINSLLVDKARAGWCVARLKGGDPYVFGRGAEEAEDLVAAGIDFEIVPGVTSAVAAPAYAGIPLTHRLYSSSVTFITGHEDPSKEKSAHNWSALANSASTLVFFMGVKNLSSITDNLLQAGMDAQTPAALVRWGTTCQQQTLTARVQDIAPKAMEAGFRAPALLIVGQVVGLRDTLSWFEHKPLLGRGVVVTRAREQASALLQLLEGHGACCFEFPTIAISGLDDTQGIEEAVDRLSHYDWCIFTSVNGVKHFWSVLEKKSLDTRALGRARVGAIGPATAQALVDRGIRPDVVPDKYVAESVVQSLVHAGVKGTKVLIPRAEKAREILPEELVRAGAEVDVVPVYRTGLAEQTGEDILQAMQDGRIHYVTFTSSSTVDNFFRLIPADRLHPFVHDQVKLACIGPITAKTLQGYGFTAHIQPREYTIPALAQALVEDAS
ncbi:MAG: uroporphyrinogen-III C-methyltransferase [Desulfovermiculus sp.]